MSVDGTYFKMMHQISLVNLVTLTAIVHPEEFIEPRRAQKLCYITTSASQHRQTARIVKPRPKTQTPKAQPPTQSNPVKISSKGTGADTKILWATHPTHPPTHNF